VRERVYGLETEYLPVFYPVPGSPAPRLRDLFDAVLEALKARHPTLPVRYRFQQGVFFGNGGKLVYEARDDHPLDGLIEAATPECRTAREAMLHSRALDRMLADAVPEAERRLARAGFRGHLLIAKNSADAEGHTYGCNENYLCDDPLGRARGALAAVLFGLVWLLLLIPARVLFYLPLAAAGLPALLVLLGATLVGRGRALLHAVERLLGSPRFEEAASRAYGRYARAVLAGPVRLYSRLCRALLFRRITPGLTPFLCTRLVYTGDGSVQPDGSFRLSTKAGVIGAVARIYFDEPQKPLIDLKHCFVAPSAVLRGRHRRLHLLGSDSSVAETAELLKLGATGLVLEWLEAGGDAGDLALRDPLAALAAVAADPELRAELELRDGTRRTALEIQEEYCRRVRAFLRGESLVGLDKWQILGEWERVLQRLRQNPETLVGEVDWVTKRFLCRAAAGAGLAAARKIDLKYHVLDRADGYWFRLERAGWCRRQVTDDDVARAMREPPYGTRAHPRGLAIASAAREGLSGRAGWDHVKLDGSPKLSLRDPLADPVEAAAAAP
jgi:proteasome accessory factor A